uniref:Sulfotransferase n=1 Tax=Vannella robusta TaxID=1487602 RepID=A0A7S4MHC7_9EUKA
MSQMANPTPPCTSAEQRDSDSRIKRVGRRFEEIERNYPGLWTEAGKSHRSHPNELEEDLLVLLHSFVMQLHVPLAHNGYREWYEDEENKEFAYIYHRVFFQMLNQAWKPDSHWVLKAPVHSTYMNELMKQYPDARIVITHRDPVSVVPSWARLLESYLNWSYTPYSCDRVKFGRYITDSLVLCANRIMKWQKQTDPKVYFDVVYSEMIVDPIKMVERIYENFDLCVTEEFRENMRQWIADNRQGKYGRRSYSLSDYNLTKEHINAEFSEYNNTYFQN